MRFILRLPRIFRLFGFLLLIVIAIPEMSRAITLSQTIVENAGVMQIQNVFTCNSNDTFCVSLCGQNSCGWKEPMCRDCFSTGDTVLRQVFQTLIPTYEPAHEIDEKAAIINMLRRTSVLVANKGIYDFFNRSSDTGFSEHLFSLCGSREGFISVLLDEEQRPTKAFMAICLSNSGLVTRALRPATEEEINLPLATNDGIKLKLKLEYELRLPK
jgi:hypothetical protein